MKVLPLLRVLALILVLLISSTSFSQVPGKYIIDSISVVTGNDYTTYPVDDSYAVIDSSSLTIVYEGNSKVFTFVSQMPTTRFEVTHFYGYVAVLAEPPTSLKIGFQYYNIDNTLASIIIVNGRSYTVLHIKQ